MVQQRKTGTKKVIRDSFVKLLKEKGMDGLTVSDITRDAGINRGTFYLHYVDKFDLIKQLENEMAEDLTQILLVDSVDPGEFIDLIPYTAILNSLYYVKNELDFIYALIQTGADANFISNFKKILAQLISKKMGKSDHLIFSKKGLPYDYALEIMLGGVISVILLWVKKGAVEPPEEIATIIDKAKQLSPVELLC
ncbi:MAG: TetR/AcrR family transcriptional regulator [Lachnospiraceae bacterium]